MSGDKFSHINSAGEAHMVDVGAKAVTQRSATAQSKVYMNEKTLDMIVCGDHHKGDVFAVARIAGIQAAKKCSDLIPLCHPLMLSSVDVELQANPAENCVTIEATCGVAAQTGVEMEALTAASVTALTIYDMCKAVDKAMQIGPTLLIRKTGGKSGDWFRE